jgi:hypothetical protein
MSVAVYPLLGALLRDRNMTITDLEREVARQYGITAERGTLERLMQPVPIHRADMDVAGAVAKALNVGLDDLFDVRAVRDGQGVESTDYLSPSDTQALTRLFTRQDEGLITDDEQQRLDALVAKQAQLVTEQWLRQIAAAQHRTLEDVSAEIDADVQRAHKEWLAFQNDPDKQAEAMERAKELPTEWPA